MELPGTHALEKEYDQAVAFETHRKNVNDAKMRAVHQVRLALCWVFLCLCNYKKKGRVPSLPPRARVHVHARAHAQHTHAAHAAHTHGASVSGGRGSKPGGSAEVWPLIDAESADI